MQINHLSCSPPVAVLKTTLKKLACHRMYRQTDRCTDRHVEWGNIRQTNVVRLMLQTQREHRQTDAFLLSTQILQSLLAGLKQGKARKQINHLQTSHHCVGLWALVWQEGKAAEQQPLQRHRQVQRHLGWLVLLQQRSQSLLISQAGI